MDHKNLRIVPGVLGEGEPNQSQRVDKIDFFFNTLKFIVTLVTLKPYKPLCNCVITIGEECLQAFPTCIVIT